MTCTILPAEVEVFSKRGSLESENASVVFVGEDQVSVNVIAGDDGLVNESERFADDGLASENGSDVASVEGCGIHDVAVLQGRARTRSGYGAGEVGDGSWSAFCFPWIPQGEELRIDPPGTDGLGVCGVN